MTNLLVFVDFSKTASLAFNQAMVLAKLNGSSLSLCHISPDDSETTRADAELKMQRYIEAAKQNGIKIEVVIVIGELFETAKAVTARLKPDLIVAGTHGTEGIHLKLFGSAIHKMVREVAAPTLVIGEACKPLKTKFKKVLVAADVQTTYLRKIELVSELLAPDGEVILFAIEGPNSPIDKDAIVNMDNARKMLDELKVNWRYVELQAKPYEVGYAAQTLAYMRDEKIEMVAISADVSARYRIFGKLDKEAILLNEDGFMVLCVNKQIKAGE